MWSRTTVPDLFVRIWTRSQLVHQPEAAAAVGVARRLEAISQGMPDIAAVTDLAVQGRRVLPDPQDALAAAVLEAVAGDLGHG
jgi:hypothetical protein